MVSSGQKLEEDSSPIHAPDWELPPNFTEQRPQGGGRFSVMSWWEWLVQNMRSVPTSSTPQPLQSHQSVLGANPHLEPSTASQPSHPPSGYQQPREIQSSSRTPNNEQSQIEKGPDTRRETAIGTEPRGTIPTVPPRRTTICGIEQKKYRRYGLILLCLVIAITALGAGLGLGLRPKRFLPLPTNTGSFNGDLTYYQPGLGACGVVSSDNQAIVSISHFLFDSLSTDPDPNRNPLCGRKLRAERLDPISNVRRSVDLTVVDRCTGCAPTDLDVSLGAFQQLANPVQGRVDVTWAWLSPPP